MTDLEQWLRDCDQLLAEGADPYTAVTQTDPRTTVQGSVQLSLDLRG